MEKWLLEKWDNGLLKESYCPLFHHSIIPRLPRPSASPARLEGGPAREQWRAGMCEAKTPGFKN
jgi:hypothetical protein